MYYKEFRMLIERVLKGNITKDDLMEYLIAKFDWEKIYDSNDEIVGSAFFTLKHYASGEEDNIPNGEWQYYIDCFDGKCKYNTEDKNAIIRACYKKMAENNK